MGAVFKAVYATIIVAWLRRTWQRVAPPCVPVSCRHVMDVEWFWAYVDGCYVAQCGSRTRCTHFLRCLAEIIGEEHRFEMRVQDDPYPWEDEAFFEPEISDRVTALMDSLDMDAPDVY